MNKKQQIIKQTNVNPIYDPLTGIANSFYFFQKFDDFLEKARKDNKKGAFIYFDIDNYKVINDTLRHAAGDLTLKMFSQSINNILKDSCFFARLNGDEFGILLYDFKDIKEIEEICFKIQNELKNPFNVMNNEIYTTASMGISIFPDNSKDVDVLLRFCDFAMYKSKRKGKNTYTFFKKEIADIYYREAQIKNELKYAMEMEELYVFYQPQIDTLTDKIIGMESLLRCNNKELGIISPSEFIPIAERTGYIVKIGNWVLDEVLNQVSILLKKGYEFKTVSINVSPIQIKRSDFKVNMLELCLKYKIPHDLIELDLSQTFKYKVITEGVETKEQMKEVANLGCNIIQGYYSKPLCVDDFEEYIIKEGVLK